MLYFHHMKMQKSINRRIYPRINPWIFAYPRIVLAANFLSLFVRLKIHGFSYPRIYPRIVDILVIIYLVHFIDSVILQSRMNPGQPDVII